MGKPLKPDAILDKTGPRFATINANVLTKQYSTVIQSEIVTSLPRPLAQARWMNGGAIAILIAALLYLGFWPGPEGLPLIKIGIPQQTVVLEANISGINDADLQSTFKPGETVNVSIDNSALLPLTLKSADKQPTTVVATQPNGTVKAQPEPRPEMQYGSNLFLNLAGKGYATPSGLFLGLKRIRVGETIKIHGKGFETSASIVNVVVKP
jgi:Domain of unknown function (DUF4330)